MPGSFAQPKLAVGFDAISAILSRARRAGDRASPGGFSMVMLVLAGIGAFAGVLAIAAGIPVKEFGVGSTLILAGVLSCCTSFILIGMWAGLKELQAALLRRRPVEAEAPPPRRAEQPPAPPPVAPPPIPYAPPAAPPPLELPARTAFQSPPPAPHPPMEAPIMMPPWQDANSSRERQPLFGGSSAEARVSRGVSLRSRIEREAAAISEAEAAPSPFAPPDALPRKPSDEPRPVQQRGRGDAQRAPRAPVALIEPRDPPILSTPARDLAFSVAERDAALMALAPDHALPGLSSRPAARPEAGIAVTVLKSGVVDGMAYWLYSDGSIEAQMPEGMMRFTSIDELRTHLDRRA